MKRLPVLAGLLVLSGTVALADPCLPGSLQDYINLGAGGCQLGVVQFTNFSTAPGQTFATPIDPSLIQVAPGGTNVTPQLNFILNSSANTAQLMEAFFEFNASGPQLGAASIALNNPSATGDGAVTGVLDVCSDFFPGIPVGCSGAAGSAIVFATQDDALLKDSVHLPLTSFFDVFVDLTVDGGLAGSAALDQASVGISSIPEPSAGCLFAAGLAALAALRSRRIR